MSKMIPQEKMLFLHDMDFRNRIPAMRREEYDLTGYIQRLTISTCTSISPQGDAAHYAVFFLLLKFSFSSANFFLHWFTVSDLLPPKADWKCSVRRLCLIETQYKLTRGLRVSADPV